MIDLRIVLPSGAAWVAAIALLPFPQWMAPAAAAAWIAAAVCLVAARLSRRSVLVVVGVSLAAMALVATAAFAGSDARRPEVVRAAHHLANATIVTTQTVTHSTDHFSATLTRVADRAVSVPVLVFDAAPASRVEIGTSLTVSGSLEATAPSDEVSYLVFATGPARVVEQPPWYLGWTNGLRAGLSNAARKLPGDGGALLPGLAIGDTTAVSADLTTAMKTSSLVHQSLVA